MAVCIVGHGIDLVEIARIDRMVLEHGDRFLNRCFTERERAYAATRPRRQAEHLAGRFAAKEAILKALGTGWTGQIAWTEAEIIREPSGQPKVMLHGRCAQIALRLGITCWRLSISHVSSHAMASAIGVGED